MTIQSILYLSLMASPVALMAFLALSATKRALQINTLWKSFTVISVAIVLIECALLIVSSPASASSSLIKATALGGSLAVLVQFLSLVIARFSARYLEGEPRQSLYIAALSGVIASVHLLLIANHWIVLIAAWSLIGIALQHLLCFYAERPWARLAAYKKRVSDRTADCLLILAAALAWHEMGSGSLSVLFDHLQQSNISLGLQVSGVALVLAVALRTAAFPTHGWLIQVMEAPTPVSALLHAGVVNLGGFVLIRFAPLLEQATFARVTLLIVGLITALLAAMVMLTRISIKVRLAWSTVAQMGFMLVECALGLYTLAALHLFGHSLYKAHAFLSASNIVRQTRLAFLHSEVKPSTVAFVLAPIAAVAAVTLATQSFNQTFWPWWWNVILGLAWAPLLWVSKSATGLLLNAQKILFGILCIVGLTFLAMAIHELPLGLQDTPDHVAGIITLFSLFTLYVWLVLLQLQPKLLETWRRWSYAGFYVDEAFTRLALQLGRKGWAQQQNQPPKTQ